MPYALSDSQMRDQGPPIIYDNTMFGYGAACWRRFYWFWRGLDYKIKPAYFITGQAHQEALDSWYSYGDADRAHEAIDRVWEASSAIPQNNDTPATNHALLDYYIQAYPTEPFRVVILDQQGKGRTTELGFQFPLAGTGGCFLGGAIDGYLDWGHYGLLVLENKTTGTYITDKYLNQWYFSFQVSQYYWALTQMVEKVWGTLMNVASKKLKVAELEGAKDNAPVPEGIFSRTLQSRSPAAMEQFVANCAYFIDEFKRQWDYWIWPMTRNPIECVGGIGKSPCPYQALCKTEMLPWEIEDPIDITRGLLTYREKPWLPWERGEPDIKLEAPEELRGMKSLEEKVAYLRTKD